MSDWTDLHANLRADGINLKWIGNDNYPETWHIGGQFAGAEGAIITGPIKGMVHVPFKGIWHEPAYGPPRYERKVDERREISTRIALMDDDQYGWFNTESKWWNGMDGDSPGYWSVFTRPYGELYLPLQLLEASETELEDDPTTNGYNCQEWDILLAADGEPRWRAPDLRPPEWVNDMSVTKSIKRDDELLAPNITVGVGKFKVANRGTTKQWPIFTVSAPGRCWLSDGSTTRMVRVPKLNEGEHATIDTNPEHRIAISDLDPVDDWTKQFIRNSEFLNWLFGEYGESGETILERFHGQGFEVPVEPNTVATLTVYHDTPGARVSVRLPQRYERPFS
jgi:hypothetical protein